MGSLLYLHFITFIIVSINLWIFNSRLLTDLGSKYFLINYIYHNHKQLSCFIIAYPFLIILLYFVIEGIIPIGTLFISVLHAFFLNELTSGKNILEKEEYLSWYKKHVKHNLSMHAHDMLKNDFNFLSERISRAMLFKFEIIFFISLVIESEVMLEVFYVLDQLK